MKEMSCRSARRFWLWSVLSCPGEGWLELGGTVDFYFLRGIAEEDAKTAELKSISEDQIRRAGRWNQEQMVGCYLNSLPRKFMCTMACHLAQMGCFEIRKASVAPPDELLSMIWPDLDT
jgi:Centromere DNA-binding protein complex CBF3 subunit, domain 2